MSRDILKYFVPENIIKEEMETSPSNNYYLVIRYFKTQKGCWEYTQGRLFRVSDNEFIAAIERNYSHFKHNFITCGDKEYLITGRSYMGLTIVDCASGQEWNYEPKKEDFCQAEWRLAPDNKTLLVSGCIWGGPYMYICYDFDLAKFDTNKGLPILPYDESLVNPQYKGIYLNEDGNIVFQQGKDIPAELRGDFIPQDENWYLVFTHPVKYNHHFKMEQSSLYFETKLWFEVVPEELYPDIQFFLDKWPDSVSRSTDWDNYWDNYQAIRKKCKSYLKKDCSVINQQVAILERLDDKIVYRYYFEIDE